MIRCFLIILVAVVPGCIPPPAQHASTSDRQPELVEIKGLHEDAAKMKTLPDRPVTPAWRKTLDHIAIRMKLDDVLPPGLLTLKQEDDIAATIIAMPRHCPNCGHSY